MSLDSDHYCISLQETRLKWWHNNFETFLGLKMLILRYTVNFQTIYNIVFPEKKNINGFSLQNQVQFLNIISVCKHQFFYFLFIYFFCIKVRTFC